MSLSTSPQVPSRGASRRALLGLVLAAPAAAFALPALAQGACPDPSDEQKRSRQILHFKPVSDDAAKQCAGCSFFTVGQGDCGKCPFVGPAPPKGVCDSWTKRA